MSEYQNLGPLVSNDDLTRMGVQPLVVPASRELPPMHNALTTPRLAWIRN
jgi:hypothetical protein